MSVLNRKTIIFALKVLVSVAIIGYLAREAVSNGHWQKLIEGPKHGWWLVGAMLASLSAMGISFYRWQVLAAAADLPLHLLDSIRICFIGLFFGLFAFGPVGGDSLRVFYVTRQAPGKIPAAITSVFADRAIGLLTMFTITAIAGWFFDPGPLAETHPEQIQALYFAVWMVSIAAVCGYLGMLSLYFAPAIITWPLVKSFCQVAVVQKFLTPLLDIVELYRNRKASIVSAFFLSVLVNVGFALTIYMLAVGLAVENNPSFFNHLVVEPIAMASNAIPLPGGIGGMEFAMKLLFLAFACDQGVIIGFAMRIVLLTLSAVGAVFWFLNRDTVARLKR